MDAIMGLGVTVAFLGTLFILKESDRVMHAWDMYYLFIWLGMVAWVVAWGKVMAWVVEGGERFRCASFSFGCGLRGGCGGMGLFEGRVSRRVVREDERWNYGRDCEGTYAHGLQYWGMIRAKQNEIK
jgi:hypothetical protein